MRPRPRDERGQALTELAVLLPLLVLIAMGALDFGRLYFAYTTVANAAHEAALCASLRTLCPAGAAAAANAEVGDSLAGGVTTTVGPVGSPGSSVTATVQYDFRPLTTAVVSSTTLPVRASATVVVQ